MTNRIGQPDTEADVELRRCLDRERLTGFVMIAGAGSGKTTSLVKALAHLAQVKGSELRRQGQRVACITYTEVAAGEIWSDVGNDSLFHISTIHSFLWTVVRPFQHDVRQWVSSRIEEKIVAAQEQRDNRRARPATREAAARDVERYRGHSEAVRRVVRFNYGTGSDYANGILGHDDVLKIGPALIDARPLLRTLIAKRFPFLFVDESQDTSPLVVTALRRVADSTGPGFCLGFFGDPMQKIYPTGIGPIEPGDGWTRITKPENFRCPRRVLHVINSIRAEDDGLQQTRGRMRENNGALEPVEGTARLFILPADERRTERLAQVRRWLAATNNDTLWLSDESAADVRTLILVHRMAARRLGFPNLYAALNDGAPPSLKDGLYDGTAWVLRPFLGFLLPLVLATRGHADFESMTLLRAHCPLLSKERLMSHNAPEFLLRLRQDVPRLVGLFAPQSRATIRQVLTFTHERELAVLNERFITYLTNGEREEADEHAESEAQCVNAFLDCAAIELLGYREYIENESPFSTQQGVKGAEFDRVLTVLDDEEGNYSLFSYGKYFRITALSATDERNIAEGSDSVLGRTRRLFYVCCSRARKDLGVVLFVPDVATARATIETRGLFRRADIHGLVDLEAHQ